MIYKLLSRLGIEVWKDIPNFKNYQVSNLGNVRSLNYKGTGKTKVLKKTIDTNGRYKLNLNGTTQRIYVLMAITFLNHKRCGHKRVVDHKDNICTNDKLHNLQVITHRLNATKEKRGTSKYPGVSLIKSTNKWQATIQINGKNKYLGYYKTEKEAYRAYQTKLKELI